MEQCGSASPRIELDPKLWSTLDAVAVNKNDYTGNVKHYSTYPGGLAHHILRYSTEYRALWLVCKQTRRTLLQNKLRLYYWFHEVTVRGVTLTPDPSLELFSGKVAEFTKQLKREAERISERMKERKHILLRDYSTYSLVALLTFAFMYIFGVGYDAGTKRNNSSDFPNTCSGVLTTCSEYSP